MSIYRKLKEESWKYEMGGTPYAYILKWENINKMDKTGRAAFSTLTGIVNNSRLEHRNNRSKYHPSDYWYFQLEETGSQEYRISYCPWTVRDGEKIVAKSYNLIPNHHKAEVSILDRENNPIVVLIADIR